VLELHVLLVGAPRTTRTRTAGRHLHVHVAQSRGRGGGGGAAGPGGGLHEKLPRVLNHQPPLHRVV
jgi:hypothetical protein